MHSVMVRVVEIGDVDALPLSAGSLYIPGLHGSSSLVVKYPSCTCLGSAEPGGQNLSSPPQAISREEVDAGGQYQPASHVPEHLSSDKPSLDPK